MSDDDEITTTETTEAETTTRAPMGQSGLAQGVPPANDPTLNDVSQTAEERMAQARADAMANHAAEHNISAGEQSNSEEEIA